ncbi:MAG: 4-deoxy-L-threo-5-hexosulose-uronate ketol-isomerase [Cellvibrionaceae bacterium]|jgi:4-deoxy-L-threo-5-hexosulose-uronate ketol-isomerase
MEMRYPVHQKQVERMTTDEIRDNFLIRELFQADKLTLVYSHIDRVIVGGAVPVKTTIALEADKKELAADTFLERREIGIINIGGTGSITVDGEVYTLAKRDGLYVGKGALDVIFASNDGTNPAQFYLFSTPAHVTHPTAHLKIEDAEPLHLGDPLNSNKRTIYKYIHPDGAQSCQIVMGMTLLEPGSMWNTMPAHLHARRMEVYLYFDIDDSNVVFHLMGEPGETRHLVMRDRDAVISPSWSIHSGMGTGSYTFIWAMAGENQSFADMDVVDMDLLR